MMFTEVRIVDRGDEPPFPVLPGPLQKCKLDRAALLQGGMASGKPSVAFIVDLPAGGVAFIETSLANFEMMAAAFRGAVQRWEEGR